MVSQLPVNLYFFLFFFFCIVGSYFVISIVVQNTQETNILFLLGNKNITTVNCTNFIS